MYSKNQFKKVIDRHSGTSGVKLGVKDVKLNCSYLVNGTYTSMDPPSLYFDSVLETRDFRLSDHPDCTLLVSLFRLGRFTSLKTNRLLPPHTVRSYSFTVLVSVSPDFRRSSEGPLLKGLFSLERRRDRKVWYYSPWRKKTRLRSSLGFGERFVTPEQNVR